MGERVHVDLFSGIGGFALAAEWAGWTTRLFCEIDLFCRDVLSRHWSDVPCHGDIRSLTAARLRDEHGIGEVDLLTGGFPCQPWSAAGSRKGADDDRHLWPEMFRVIQETRPRYVLGENVRGLVKAGLDDIVDDLESEGYACEAMVIGAVAVNAPHRRDRVWILANDTRASPPKTLVPLERLPPPSRSGVTQASFLDEPPPAAPLACRADPRLLDPRWQGDPLAAWDGNWEEGVSRTAEREPQRVAKLKALGNAVVPQVPYVILMSLLESEHEFYMDAA